MYVQRKHTKKKLAENFRNKKLQVSESWENELLIGVYISNSNINSIFIIYFKIYTHFLFVIALVVYIEKIDDFKQRHFISFLLLINILYCNL